MREAASHFFRRHRRKLRFGLMGAIGVVIALWATVTWVAYPVRVSGTSMLPALRDGDLLLVNRIPLWFGGTPKRLDIVLVAYPGRGKATYVKRVIGLPGETIAIQDGVVYVDDQPLAEPYLQQMPNYRMAPYALGDDQYFVLGDNRPRSEDSHVFGAVYRTMISGVIGFRLSPIERMGPIPFPALP